MRSINLSVNNGIGGSSVCINIEKRSLISTLSSGASVSACADLSPQASACILFAI